MAVLFVASTAIGCGEQAEPPPPAKAVVFRQKITMPKEAPSTAAKPESRVAEQTPAAKPTQTPSDKLKEKTAVAQATPAPPLKKDEGESLQVAKKPEEGVAPPAEEEKSEIAYFYNPEGKIDPFKPIASVTPLEPRPKEKFKKKRLPQTPLEKVDLSQLKLVGIIVSRSGGNKALVEEPSGKGYVISKGTYVGTNAGRVEKIYIDRVVVREEVEDLFSGKIKSKSTELILQKKLGDG